MGAVYEAIDDRVSCVVAVKETLVATDGEARRAFEREAALLANLRHASLPKVMDHFTENEGQFLVMEYVPGYDLAELMEMRGSAFPPDQVMQWADELLKVLEYLHGRVPPILHRDIKPSNLKLTRQGEIFLLDFGLAKGSAGQMPTLLTSRSVRGYTPVYASFEQVYGKGTDPRSDLYSLGATLYHLLTGVPPTDAPTRFDALEDEQADPLPPIQEINPQVSQAVASVINRAMAVSRKGRPANATEMRRALSEAVEETQRAATDRLEKLEREKEHAAEAARLHAEAEAERERAEESARRRAAEEEERQRQEEAETLRLQIEKSRLRLEEERSRREAEEEETKRRTEQTKAGQKNAVKTVAARTQRAKDIDAPLATSGVKTLEGKPDQLYKSADAVNTSQVDTTARRAVSATGMQSRRRWIVAAVAVLIIASVFAVVWITRKSSVSSESTQKPEVANQQSQIDEPPREKPLEPTPPSGMAYVPGGEFTMGRDDGDEYERPAHKVTVKPFFIDIYEVTNEDYANFIRATNHVTPPGWTNASYPAGARRHPVTGVTWNDAVAYAKWAVKRLPTEEEWEFAARGTDGRRYPWGRDWRGDLANAHRLPTEEGLGVREVGTYKGQSPFGVLDMVGNAWEWTASDLVPYVGGKLPERPAANTKVLRGGSFKSSKNQATTTYRFGWRANEEASYAESGFRCVQDMTGADTQQ